MEGNAKKLDPRIRKVVNASLRRCLCWSVFVQLFSYILPLMIANYIFTGSIVFKRDCSKEEFYGTLLLGGFLIILFYIALIDVFCISFLRSFARKKGADKTKEYVVSTEFRNGKGVFNWIIVKFSGVNKQS